MEKKLGYQLGLESRLPMGELETLSLVNECLDWQLFKGPCIIFVDEPFYRFLVRTGIDEIYQDIIPLPEDIKTEEEAIEYALMILPCDMYKIEDKLIPNDPLVIADQKAKLPENIQKKWHDIIMNEMLILSLHNIPQN
jgi:hypothetical protein